MNKVIVDCETGEVEVVPLTAQEVAEREAARLEAEREAAAEAASDATRKAKHDALKAKLKLSPEELATLKEMLR